MRVALTTHLCPDGSPEMFLQRCWFGLMVLFPVIKSSSFDNELFILRHNFMCECIFSGLNDFPHCLYYELPSILITSILIISLSDKKIVRLTSIVEPLKACLKPPLVYKIQLCLSSLWHSMPLQSLFYTTKKHMLLFCLVLKGGRLAV